MCVHTRPKPSVYTPQHSIPGLLSVFCVCGMCIHVHSHVWRYMCGSQRLMAGVFLNCFLLYLLLQGLLLNPRLPIQRDGQLTQRIFCDCLLKHRGYRLVLIPIRVFVWTLRLPSEDLTLHSKRFIHRAIPTAPNFKS